MTPRPTVCEYCRRSLPSVVIHHIFGRRMKAIRDDPDNHCCLCLDHHTNSSEFSAHKTPTKFKEWIINTRGEEWWNRLLMKKRLPFGS